MMPLKRPVSKRDQRVRRSAEAQMTNWREDESEENELEDRELLDDSDVDDDSNSVDLLKCPECGTAIYHDVAICPRCGHFISEIRSINRKPLWIVVGVAICLVIIAVQWLR